MQEHLECVREVDELLVVRGEEDGLARLRAVEVDPQDVVQEEVRLCAHRRHVPGQSQLQGSERVV